MIKNYFFTLFLTGITYLSYSQVPVEKGILLVDGLVSGYNHDPTRKLFQKEREIVLEGTLEKVLIQVTENGSRVTSAWSNKKGEFRLKLNIGNIYRVELTKAGHEKSVFLIDVKNVPKETADRGLGFTRADLVLNSFQSTDTEQLNQPFGRLFYDIRKKHFDFESAPSRAKKGFLFKSDEPDIAVSLMRRNVLKNIDNVYVESKPQVPVVKIPSKKNHPQLPVKYEPDTDTAKNKAEPGDRIPEFNLSPNPGIENLSELNISFRDSEISAASRQLAMDKSLAKTREDSTLIQEREYLLNAAVVELNDAKKMIELQKNHIAVQKNQLILAVSGLILLFGLLFVIYIQYSGKIKINAILKDQNQKITESINYARHIQQSILPQTAEIRKRLPESFIYYQPRDIVSGDFYWYSEIGGKIIIAAVDCTGHGVPGAFMSLIGNILLNEIINEKKILLPSAILKQLHLGVLNSLHQDADETNSQDGMEMSLCVIDPQQKVIEFGGAMNPIYLVHDGQLQVIKPDIQSIGGVSSAARKHIDVRFTDQQIPIVKGMSVYLFTDGYMDQFGGPSNKKFNTSMFKKLLLDIQSQDMDKQWKSIEEAILKWKGKNRQVDDMLVMGLKF